VLAVWEGSVRGGLVNPFWISAPSLIGAQAWALLAAGDLLPHLRETLVEMLLGLAAGCLVGVPAGIALGAVAPVRRVVEPYLVVLNAFPKIALAPLYLVWFGIALTLKVAMAFSLVVFVMMLGTFSGFGSVRPEWVHHARLLGASRLQVARAVLLPALLPWIYTSFRLSVGFALMGAVLGEFIATQRGIGYLIDQGVGMFDTATVFVGLLLLLLIALASNALTEWIGGRLHILGVQLRSEQVL
jgi:NitT/TauT family transport system permease protein